MIINFPYTAETKPALNDDIVYVTKDEDGIHSIYQGSYDENDMIEVANILTETDTLDGEQIPFAGVIAWRHGELNCDEVE